jgi:hypothetical protein
LLYFLNFRQKWHGFHIMGETFHQVLQNLMSLLPKCIPLYVRSLMPVIDVQTHASLDSSKCPSRLGDIHQPLSTYRFLNLCSILPAKTLFGNSTTHSFAFHGSLKSIRLAPLGISIAATLFTSYISAFAIEQRWGILLSLPLKRSSERFL